MIYDIDGNSLNDAYNKLSESIEMAYDKNGNVVFTKNAHPIVPPQTQLDFTIPSQGWVNNGNNQYATFKNAFMSTNLNAIPIFVCTDPHGNTGVEAHRWFHNVNDIQAVNMNLGDICVDYFTNSALQNYDNRTEDVDYFIGIVGNHDCKMVTDTPTQTSIRSYFTDTVKFTKELIQTDDTANYVVYDNIHNIKFVCCDWYTKIGEDANGTMPYPHTTTTSTTWFLNELSKNDGYDIIVLQHALFTDTYIHDDGTTQTWADAPTCIERLWNVVKDRKNKRAGTYIDADGVSHSYDFTNCQTELICTLHGHAHEQLHLREDGLTSFAFNKFYTCNFVILDVDNHQLSVWTFTYDGMSDGALYTMEL